MDPLPETIGDEVSWAAFRRLLRTGRETKVAELASDLGRPVREIAAAVEDISRQGRLRLDGQGRVVDAAGLSIGPDRHQIDIDGRRFWTWCAYDILGEAGGKAAQPRREHHQGEFLDKRYESHRPFAV